VGYDARHAEPKPVEPFGDREELHDHLRAGSATRLPELAEVANVAAFVASDRASAMMASDASAA
jgi:hypothetical protein